jgi:hypothetical protein
MAQKARRPLGTATTSSPAPDAPQVPPLRSKEARAAEEALWSWDA